MQVSCDLVDWKWLKGLAGARADDVTGVWQVEPEGPPGCLRVVAFHPTEDDAGLAVAQPIVVEGELLVIRHNGCTISVCFCNRCRSNLCNRYTGPPGNAATVAALARGATVVPLANAHTSRFSVLTEPNRMRHAPSRAAPHRFAIR